MADGATTARAAAVKGFADVLSGLRDSVGRPSFRVMAGRSRAISHTTLHEAVQGHRLPSWGTTAQFVQACGADPEDYRERWEQANRLVGSAGAAWSAAPPAPRAASAAEGAAHRVRIDVPFHRSTDPPDRLLREEPLDADPPAMDGDQPPRQAVPPAGGTAPAVPAAPRRRRRGWYAVVGATAAGVLVTGAGVAWSRAQDDDRTPSSQPTRYVASNCPVKQQNPPVQPPEHEGDQAAFIADVTVPDCTHVRRGQTVLKVWRFKNAGVVPWSGYTLHRVDLPQTREHCQTITDVPIADTPPGKVVDVKVEVTVPSGPAFCFVRFKLVDARGRIAFPASRPVNFQVIVD